MNGRPADDPDASGHWRLDIDDVPLLRSLAHVGPCLLGGIGLLVVSLVGWLAVSAVVSGDAARAAALVALAALGLASGRYVPAMLATAPEEALLKRYAYRWLAAGSVLGAAVLLVSARLHPGAPLAVFVVGWLPTVVAAHFPTTGRVDPGTKTLVVDDRKVPLDAVREHRTASLVGVTVYWLSYVRGSPTAPRVVVVPSERAATIADLLDRTPTVASAESERMPPQVRTVVVAFGLGLLAVGPALWALLPPGDGAVIALYAGAMFGLFGGLLLWYGYAA